MLIVIFLLFGLLGFRLALRMCLKRGMAPVLTRFLVTLLSSSLLALLLLPPASLFAQLSTDDHLAEPGFWPTQSASSRKDFVGSASCAPCHGKIVASQRATPMGATAMHAADSDILHAHSNLHFSFPPYRYGVQTAANRNTYSIAEGDRNLSATLLWAFGTGRVGQSYLFKREDGNFYEARVTYFSSLQDLHFTPARALTAPAKSLEEAMYRPVGASEIARCFGCHTTASNVGGQFEEANLILGVSCEACHGAGANHVEAMKASKLSGIADSAASSQIFNPRQLAPSDSVDFCGACHGTWWDTKLAGVKGPSNARSQPYRLQNSKCWSKADARITCIACHDPHQQLQTEPAAYDGACVSCHAVSVDKKRAVNPPPAANLDTHHPGAACPVATKDCVTCHMPKVFVPEMHHNFTDHRIRIVNPNDGYPE